MKSIIVKNNIKFDRRHARVRAKISGTKERPRFSIFKSHKYISAQLIDDMKGHTLVSGSTKSLKAGTPVARAEELGLDIAKKAKKANIEKVVFDKSGYIYTGKIKVVADAARKGGLIF
jgi:large subunit ribosomal protein L18